MVDTSEDDTAIMELFADAMLSDTVARPVVIELANEEDIVSTENTTEEDTTVM